MEDEDDSAARKSWAHRDELETGNDNVISLTDWLKKKATAPVATEALVSVAA